MKAYIFNKRWFVPVQVGTVWIGPRSVAEVPVKFPFLVLPAKVEILGMEPTPLSELIDPEFIQPFSDDPDIRYCICADPENCTEPIPGYVCRPRRKNVL